MFLINVKNSHCKHIKTLLNIVTYKNIINIPLNRNYQISKQLKKIMLIMFLRNLKMHTSRYKGIKTKMLDYIL